MSQENLPGGNIVSPTRFDEHLAVDRARPRAGHPLEFGGLEHTVTDISDPDVLAANPAPDPRMGLKPVGLNTRPSRIPVWMTVRRGFEHDLFANLGNRAPLVSPIAQPDPLQSMEESPTYIAQTVRITPTPWDETLIIGGNQ